MNWTGNYPGTYAVTMRRLYLGKHRGQYNRAMDNARKNGTPYVPRHAYGTPGGEAA